MTSKEENRKPGGRGIPFSGLLLCYMQNRGGGEGPALFLTFHFPNARINAMNKKIITVCITGILIIAACLTGCQKRMEPVSRSSFLLNTFITVTLYDSRDEKILDGVTELCSEFEKKFSTTIETSEIYAMNHRKPGERTFTVSPDTAELIKKGLEYSRLSEGAFDITIEPLSRLWDFSGSDPHVPSGEAIQEALLRVGYERVAVRGSTVTFADDSTSIDLGAIAKGYIADRMKAYLKERGVESAVINLGGNVLCLGERPGGKPFKIGLQKPFADRTETVAVLDIRDMSVVSSGVYERHFEENGVNYHHILNPSTGWPYENNLTQVTILSEQSADGDGLSTACFALGLADGMKLVDSLDGVFAVFVTEDGALHYSEGAEAFISSS